MAKRPAQQRIVHDVIDGDGLYCSRAAAGGPYVFLSSPAVSDSGQIAEEVRVKPPYHHSPSANVRAQTSYIFDRYRDALGALDSSIEDIVQLEQYITRKIHSDGFTEVSRGPGNLEHDRPGSALIQTGDLSPDGCVVNPTAIAVVPDGEVKKEIGAVGDQGPGNMQELGDAYEEPLYNEIVTAGGYVFTVGDWSCDYGQSPAAIHAEAKTPDWIWWGSEIRREADFIFRGLESRLKAADSLLENVVHATTFLIDLTDQYDFDLVWQEYFPVDPPARTVIPVRGLGIPRREGACTHAEGAIKMEQLCQSIRPGFGVERQVISTGAEPLSHESEAILARPLLWTSGLLAGGPDGLRSSPDTSSQVAYLFNRLDDICQAAGTNLQNLLRLRAYVTDPHDAHVIYAALRQAVPSEPPCVAITGVPGALQVPGCTVMMDAVAYVPE